MERNWKRVDREEERAGWEKSVGESIEVDTFPTEMPLLAWMGRRWALKHEP
jgi:hypothetical protein